MTGVSRFVKRLKARFRVGHKQPRPPALDLRLSLLRAPLLRPDGFPQYACRVALLLERKDLTEAPNIMRVHPHCRLDRIVVLAAGNKGLPELVTFPDESGVRAVPVSPLASIKQFSDMEYVFYQTAPDAESYREAGIRLDGYGVRCFHTMPELNRLPAEITAPHHYATWRKQLEALHESLEDEDSKLVLAARVKATLTGCAGYLPLSGYPAWNHPACVGGKNGRLVLLDADASGVFPDGWLEDVRAAGREGKATFLRIRSGGREVAALRAAEETLRRRRSQVAVDVSHAPATLLRAAEFLKSLELGYRFYLGHHSPQGRETILYAAAER